MKFWREALGHPLTLVGIAILAGIGAHRLLNLPGPWSDPAAIVSRSPGRETPAKDSGAVPEASPVPPAPAPQPEEPPRAEPAAEAIPEAVVLPAGTEPAAIEGLEPVPFREIWAYLMIGEERRWRPEAPVTDVGLFAFRLDEVGGVIGRLPQESIDLARSRGARAHLVVASSGQKSLLHFLLDPACGKRHKLVLELAALARRHPVDGFQLDFESLRVEDRESFLEFLRELRAALPPEIIFSMALPARMRESLTDAFRYKELGPLADRFLIMVYDEHWQGGRPGSVSSKKFHDRVVAHALQELPPDKVIVGLPLYGRIWQHETVARATRYSDLAEILSAPGAELRYDPAATNRFTFRREVTAEGWFDDAASLHAKFASARAAGAAAVGFWRLGQEDPRVWTLLQKP